MKLTNFKVESIINKIFTGVFILVFSLTSCVTEDVYNEVKYKPVTVETAAASSVTATSVVVGGIISAPQERKVTRGVCWSTDPNPEISLSAKTTNGTGLGAFSSSITGLVANTTYYVRAYATSALSTVYGNQVSVKTAMPTTATITTAAVSAITSITATCGGDITSDGGASVIARGVCWSTTTNPTISNSKTTDGTGTGAFSSSLTGLAVGTTYYVRAYATNSAGTTYGAQQTFNTTNFPTLTTVDVSNITTISALSGGNISSDGGSTILSCGVCWSTTLNPTIANFTATASGIGYGFTGGYTVSLNLLLPSTTYYVRAYATNSVGTTYGSQVSFTTISAATVPSLTTTSANSITATSSESGGSISSDGGATVTARGVCWSTSQNPTISLSTKTSNGTGTGSFTSSITGLSPSTTYYVRAYATNSVGTAYGAQVSFTTTATSTVSTVTSPTGKVWMDRNLGASRVATSSTDAEAYGDLYQWGRRTDGHEKRTSATTSSLSSSDSPGHGNFIIGSSDWRSSQNDNLWQGVNGINNPCPVGFRIPTIAEWEAERTSWSSNNSSGSFASPLKLTVAGYRSSSALVNVGSYGYYWSASVNGLYTKVLYFSSSVASTYNNSRALGFSVRCLKDN
jgi:hypothetical protein